MGQVSDKRTEVIAGCVAGFVAIPQCVALGVTAFAPFHGEYATLAQVTGFASAIVAGLFVSIFGRGQVSLTGPRIGATIVIAGTLTSFLQPSHGVALSHEVVLGLILIVMMLAGAIQAILGHAQLASLHNYIARPVIVGLLTGVAATMLFKQAKLMFSNGLGFSLVATATAGLAGWIWWLGKNSSIKFWRKEWIVRLGVPIAAAIGIGLYFSLKHTGLWVGGTLSVIDNFWLWPDVGPSLVAGFSSIAGKLGLLGGVISAAVMLAIVSSIDTTTAYVNTKKKLRDAGFKSNDSENNELKWHGIGNVAATFFGGMTSSASDARAAAAVGVGGKTWLAGLVYVVFLTILLVSSPHLPWTDYFPQAVISGLMLQIAVVLLEQQSTELKRYWLAVKDAFTSRFKRSSDTIADIHRQKFYETALNGVAVCAVALSLNWFDPLKAVSLGMFCSMLIFLFKIGQSQRHRWYEASYRASLETRVSREQQSALEARSHCYVIKLHGDYFFLSRKKTNDIFEGISTNWKDKDKTSDAYPYVILDFDMAHEFDESGVSEIKVLIEKLKGDGFKVHISYLNIRSNLYQLMLEDGFGLKQAPTEHDPQDLQIDSVYVFDSTERAINFVEDGWILKSPKNSSSEEVETPCQLESIVNLPPVSGATLHQTDEAAKYWIVCKGKVTLRVNVRQSVADAMWSKVVAEVGLFGVISDRSIRTADLVIECAPGTELKPITEAFLRGLKVSQPLQAVALLEYLIDHLDDTNAMLQLEALMLDH